MERYTLKDLESVTGIKSDTIRIWEKRYGILSPHLTPGKRRFYNDSDLIRLINVSIINRHGTKISKIASMTGREIREKAAILSETSTTSGDIIGLMLIAMNRLDEIAINEALLKSVIEKGFEATITDVVFPFLRKVGLMWHTGAVNEGTEHFITAVLRQRLIASLDSLPPSRKNNGKKIIAFLPEGELHELGLLYYTYLLRKSGHEVLYLGQSTPLGAVIKIAVRWDPDMIVTGMVSDINLKEQKNYLAALSLGLKGKKIFVAGILARKAEQLNLPGVIPFYNEEDLMRNLD
ncbi:MAG: cobalamin B12-binding domain-containing protein [Bacteroidales bacterium]|nr:cobalamin B12-binding domain-containing protein [Bacteroidales bacterium]